MANDVITARLVIDPSALKNIGGKLGEVATKGKEKGGNGGVLGAIGGAKGAAVAGIIAGAVSAGTTALLSVLKKGFSVLTKASPRLQATFSIFSRSIMLLLRPLADVVNLILRPVALAMLKWVVGFYKKWKENFSTVFKDLGGDVGKGQ